MKIFKLATKAIGRLGLTDQVLLGWGGDLPKCPICRKPLFPHTVDGEFVCKECPGDAKAPSEIDNVG